MMAASLEGIELDEDDRLLLGGQLDEETPTQNESARPVVAIIGRPNVGKSTLVNRIVGRRVAVVQDVPGVTRDRVTYQAEWAGHEFTLMDTGGWESRVSGMDKSVADQAELAIQNCDAVVFVVDATVGPTDSDEKVVSLLRKSKKPVILCANKVDSPAQEADAALLWSLGLGQPYPVSALHGRGSGDLLDAIIDVLPETSQVANPTPAAGPRRVALVGKPNVGKSSLLNQLLGEHRVVVDSTAGTTRDPVDEYVELDGKIWQFIDTAGIKRKLHRLSGAEYYASLRTEQAIERAEVALVLIDASMPLSDQDIRVIQQVIDAGRALVIVNNKWDLVDEYRQKELRREQDRDLVQVPWAPRINISAKTGWHTNRLVKALETALEGWQTRIPTGKLNSFFGRLVAANPHPLRGGKQPRILFATQAGTCPPRFVLFTTGFLDPSYRRFIERRLREEFNFEGSPIQISVRERKRRKK